MQKRSNRLISYIMCAVLVLGLAGTGNIIKSAKIACAASYSLYNPLYEVNETIWDCIYFGNYWQDDTNGDGVADKKDEKKPIRWRVLSVEGDEALLLADNGLDCQKYDEGNKETKWEECELREWLNGTFYNEAFDSNEKQSVMITDVDNATKDKVYLLSVNEVTDPSFGFEPKDNKKPQRSFLYN